MTITERNGKFYCRFQINGERKHLLCRGATDIKSAKKIECAFMYKLQQQQNGIIPKDSHAPALKKILQLYTEYAEINNKDYEHQTSKINVLLNFLGAKRPADTVQRQDIESLRLHLKNTKGLGNSTINRYISILSKAYNLAIADNLIKENPCKNIRRLKENNTIIRYLTADEEQRLFQCLPCYLEPIVLCALLTALRKRNILNLRWEQINIDKRYIEIEKQNNKGAKQLIIPIADRLLNALKQMGVRQRGFVFVNRHTQQPYKNIDLVWRNALKKADIKNFRFHDLRHTAATRMIEKGADIKTVQELLGHSSLAITQKYVHTNISRKKEAIALLNSYS